MDLLAPGGGIVRSLRLPPWLRACTVPKVQLIDVGSKRHRGDDWRQVLAVWVSELCGLCRTSQNLQYITYFSSKNFTKPIEKWE